MEPLDLPALNQHLETATAQERVAWALDAFPGDGIALTSSFGAQAAVCLHLVATQRPGIPVILLDTGYLFPETYKFIDQLTEQLDLNLQVFRAALSPAWQEARHGKLWEQGLPGITQYNDINKVEPMRRALQQLNIRAWFAGLRRDQASTRESLPVLQQQHGVLKIHPIVDWHAKDIHRYLTQNGLPYHPLWEQGYVSIGDWHTTRRLEPGMTEEETRFFGLKRECGIHEDAGGPA